MLQIFSEQLKRHPLMQPQDAVKLLYQSEFGPGHMITDREVCLARLKAEYADVRQNNCAASCLDAPLAEDIGNGFARVNLASPDMEKLPLEALADMFIRSANAAAGSADRFSGKLEQLKDSYRSLPFAFTYMELSDFLEGYKAAGCPAVHHSDLYRQLYRPSYRVVKAQELERCGIFSSPE